MIIEDGTGKGFKAQVDNENRLTVRAIMQPLHQHVNEDEGDAYLMDIDGIQTDGADYWLAIIKNEDDRDLVITGVTGWVPSFDNTQIYEVYMGGTFVYATNGTAVVPANTNAGSGKTASGVFYVNDGTGNITTIAGTQTLTGRHVFGTIPCLFAPNGGWVVPKNQVWLLRSDLAEKLTGYISFFYH